MLKCENTSSSLPIWSLLAPEEDDIAVATTKMNKKINSQRRTRRQQKTNTAMKKKETLNIRRMRSNRDEGTNEHT